MAGDRGHRSSARPKPVTPLTLGEAPGADSTLIAVPPGPRFRDNFTRASREDSVPKQRVRIAGAVLTHASRITWLEAPDQAEPGRSGWQPRSATGPEG
jgi:hypothetical protein